MKIGQPAIVRSKHMIYRGSRLEKDVLADVKKAQRVPVRIDTVKKVARPSFINKPIFTVKHVVIIALIVEVVRYFNHHLILGWK